MLGAEVARELERRLGRVELARDADEEALEALDRLGAVPGLWVVVCIVYNGEREKEIRTGERSHGAER